MLHHFLLSKHEPQFTIDYVAPTQSRNFDNSAGTPNDHFTCPSSSMLDNLTNDSFTYSFWLNPDSNTTNTSKFLIAKNTRTGIPMEDYFTGFLGRMSPSNNFEFRISQQGDVDGIDDAVFKLLARTTTRNVGGSPKWQQNTWVHVIYTYDINDKNFRIILNDIEDLPYALFEQANGFSADDSAQNLIIGADTQSPADRGIDGSLLHAALWTGVAANSAQRTAIFNNGNLHDLRLVNMSPGSNVAFWPFDNNFGAQDISENFLDGTFTGTTLVTDVP